MVILESATLGLPLVVRDIPEYEGFLTHGVNCLKAQDNGEFSEHLQRIAQDAVLRERLRQGALALADVHDLVHVGQRLRTLYSALLEKREPASVS